MPYADPAAHREHMREYMRAKRAGVPFACKPKPQVTESKSPLRLNRDELLERLQAVLR